MWREEIIALLGARLFSVLGGISFEQWVRLLRDNDFDVDARYWPRALLVTLSSLRNSLRGRRESKLYGREVSAVEVRAPIFILGHWRSGTTFLHNLLAAGGQFGYPNLYQVFNPSTFLSTEERDARMFAYFLPERRMQDNVPLSPSVPQEDEFALCTDSLCSQYLAWVFPRRQEFYERYLTMRGASEADLLRWRKAFLVFLQKLTWKFRRPLLLKSPTHTCRIKLILELFPDAKFIHIYRHPHQVFLSSRHSYELAGAPYYLQRPDRTRFDELIISRYRVMYDAFFEERALIARDRLFELSFERLRRDPLLEARQLYGALELPGYSEAEPRLREYLASQRDYRMNTLPELPGVMRERLAADWARSFEEWGYAR